MTGCDHGIQLRVEEAGVKMKLLRVAVGEGGVRIHDAHQLHIMLRWKLLQETGDMPVLQANNGYTDRLSLRKHVGAAQTRDS
jgi:hypothetical protein